MKVHLSLLLLVVASAVCLVQKQGETCSSPGDSCVAMDSRTFENQCTSIPLRHIIYLPRCEGRGSSFNVCCSKLLPPSTCSKLRPPQRKTINSRISYGQTAQRGDWPWIVAVGYMMDMDNEIKWECGGSLLNDLFVLTAAHCYKERNRIPGYYLVRLGDLDLKNNLDMNHVDIKVRKFLTHDKYVKKDYGNNDIALIKLEKRVKFTNYILPVCLPVSNGLPSNYIGKTVYVAGWGFTEQIGVSSDKLLEVAVKVKKNSDCYEIQEYIDKLICTVSESDKKDSCQGDSGGPMMAEINGAYYQIGVVSSGKGSCGTEGSKGFYMNVRKYIDWILNTMESNKN